MTLYPKKYTELDMRQIFEAAYNYYDQKIGGKGNIYISKKTVNDLHIAVLPNKNTYVFSEYNFGNDEDVEKLQHYQRDTGTHKTYLCSLCPILEEDNAVILSDEQNQLYLNKNDSPAVNLRYILIGNSGSIYTITGTVPQYYYGHLVWSTVDHVPTYALFLAKNIFSDLLLFLRHCTQTEPKTKAFFNGTFGSDIYHCHVHLSNQDTSVLEDVYNAFNNYPANTEVYTYDANIIKLIVITSTDIERLFKHVSGICTEYIKIRDTNPSIVLTANLAYTKDRYWVTFQKIDRNYATWEYNNCGFYTMPASFVMISDCMKVPQTQTEYDAFTQAQLTHYANYYQRWDYQAYFQNFYGKFDDYLDTIGKTPFNQDILKNPVEFLWIKINWERILIDQQTASNILEYLGSTCISQKAHCDNHTMGKYKYLIGLAVNNLPINILNTKFGEIRINAIFYFLREYVANGVKSDYLFFRGTFAQKLLVKTFENFLKITGTSNGVNLPLTEYNGVNTWLKYNFKRIGEPSASAAGATLSELVPYKYNDKLKVNVEFFIKIIFGTNQANFLREFFAAMSVNDIRNLVPNYMLCYGGFMCNGDKDNEKLCNDIAGNPFSYLLLENIKNSETVDRVLKLPSLATREDAQDLIDMIYQIVAGLCVGWEANQFTHYDLHLDNIMRYDFVSNKDFLNLFKIYQEEKGDAIPEIEKILFKYYTDPNNPNKVFHVPVKYLYVIIDYGITYTKDMPPASLSRIGWLENNGFDSTKPNSYCDIYTMISFFLLRVMVSKPYLVFDKNGIWLQNNILVDFFQFFLTNFAQLFITDITQVMQSFSNLQKSNPQNRRSSFNDLYIQLVKPEHAFVVAQQGRIQKFPHFLKNFDLSSVGDSFSSSWKLLNFMYERYYANINFEEIEKQDEVYVFNWGYTPENIIRGIEPNSQIKDMIDQKDHLKKQKIGEVRNFIQNI
jgi:hypothetical protein